ncbi:DMT family transporter [Vibrio ostreicida]|uniref:DMT family transporter n=1 Tax=Vibrio ostreicida TaxID=526588 RepID=A0ABT8BSW9_9VIBR|nr:DMT family transporter [Vibrio ostreicida]MDN3609763.1 DMT family transporter [Vibrio ostreicida]NPD09407.1 DMT family transporter [Vibrio ostreicida]
MSHSQTGALFVLAFLLMANANAVLSGWLLQTLHPFTLLFWSFLATSVFFLLRLRITQSSKATRISRDSIRPLLLLNIASSLSWIGYYFALRYIEPAIVSALMGGIGPLFVVLSGLILLQAMSLRQVVTSTGIIIGAIVLAWASVSEQSAVQNVSQTHIVVGLVAALIGGFGQVLTTLSTKRLADKNWDASQLMAHRFYLLIAVSGFAAFNGPSLTVQTIPDLFGLLLVGIFGVLVPLWLLQKGIINSSPFTVSVLLALGPLMTLCFQGFDSRLSLSLWSVIGCVIIVVSTVNNFLVSSVKLPFSNKSDEGRN